MADTVHFLLEDMIPELDDLEERGYFTRAEIKQIVRKRTDFEYLLKRRAALKADYLNYIQYESRLEELRRLRKDAAGLTGAKKSLADHALVRRVHFIFERATRKFRGDLALWHSWLQFCKDSRSARQMSKVLTKALQLHPTAAGLWIYAAAWEVEHNRNVAAARALMQRGLRMCKGDVQLWVEYFRLELLYAHMLRARRKVLGIDAARGKEAAEGAEGGEDGAAEAEAAVEAVLSGKVAEVVFRNAVAALPRAVAVRRRFLDTLQPFNFPGVASVAQVIYASLEEDFPGDEEAWDLRARRHMGAHAVPSAADAAAPAAPNAGTAVPAAAVAAAAAASAAAPRSAAVWRQHLLLQAQQAMAQGDGAAAAADQLGGLVRDAVRAVPAADGAELWALAFQTLSGLGVPLEGLSRDLEAALAAQPKGPLQGGLGEAAASAIAAVRQRHGLGEARAFYRRLLALPPAGGQLFHAALDLELGASASERPTPQELCAVFEAAVEAYGSEDVELWLRYARWEVLQGRGAGKIHWRATKALADPQVFIDRLAKEQAAGKGED
ncbi:hypothetical protein WJX81_007266 [Elliptochloris bilobata]|uniref:U3 small nucleolar RNA-associated protein 6 n=1 Tax=Elliptochloris bilobata TaxID=381761 RepID=A0AAW1RTW9_9CHLO